MGKKAIYFFLNIPLQLSLFITLNNYVPSSHCIPSQPYSFSAALVICGSILKDFVLPKLNKTKKYVICPYIDMCNHK